MNNISLNNLAVYPHKSLYYTKHRILFPQGKKGTKYYKNQTSKLQGNILIYTLV